MTTEAEVAPATVEAVMPNADAPVDAKVDKAETEVKSESKDAPKEVPKPDQPRLPKPDRAALEASIAELQEAADVQQARIETLKRAIESRREKRKNITSGSQETRARIGELNAAFSTHMEERNAIRKELIALDAVRERAREQTLAMKQKLRFHTVEAVDREIARMEDTLAHTSMPLSEEKKMVVAIKDLSKSRETVKEYGEMQSKISGEDGSRKAIIERLRAKDAEINAVKAEQQRIRGELDATRSKGDEVGADIPKMQEERNACYEVIKGKREEIRGLRAAHKKAEDEYWTREKLWRAYLKQEKQKQWEASVKEREAREEARKQWERENAPEPFEAEVTAADQLVAYLAKWDPASSEKDDAAAAAAKAAEVAAAAETAKAFEGLQLVGKKNKNDDDDDLFSLSGTSKGKKAKRAGKSAAKSAETGAGPNPNERLNISFDAYGSFSKLSLAAPSTVGEVPAMLASLREKKAELLEKRRVKKERIAAGLEDEDEKEKKAAAKEDKGKKGRKNGKEKKGAKKRGGVSVTLEVVDDAVVVAIAVDDSEE